MKFESIIFDVDGTLWDSRALLAGAYNEQLREENIDLAVDEVMLKPLFGRTMTALADGLFPMIPAPERYGLMDRCIVKMDEHLEKYAGPQIGYPELRPTMEALAKKHRLFIVSNGQSGYPQMAAKKLGLEDLIEGYLSFGDTGKSKGQTLKILAQQHNIRSAAYVGDTQGDLEATREAGMAFIWTSFGFGAPEEYDLRADKFSDLQDL